MAIDFELTPELQQIKATSRELAKDFATRAGQHDAERSAPVENYEKLRDAGFYGLTIPKDYGGKGAGMLGYVVAIEELAQGCPATALSWNMHASATAGIIEHPDVPENMKRHVAELAINQGKLMCTSVSEPASSSLIAQSYTPSLQAVKVNGGHRLNGKKAFASMFESSDYVYLYAHPAEDSNPQASIGFLAPTKADGIVVQDVWDTLGMRATRSNTVKYKEAFVPDELVLHKTDAFLNSFIIQGANWSFGSFAAVYYGVGLGALKWARELLTTRNAKGYSQPMAYHPSIRRRLGEMYADMEAARLSIYHAAWYSDTHGPSRETFANFLRAKYIIGQSVSRTIRNASIACGVHGLMKTMPFERILRDATTAPIMPPNEDACLDQIGLLDSGLNPAEAMPFLRPASL